MRYTHLALVLLGAATAGAEPAAIDRVYDNLLAVRRYSEVAMAPDGGRVAWVEQTSGGSEIFVFDLRGKEQFPRRISASTGAVCQEDSPAWSRDSARLAFLSDCEQPGQAQLYAAAASGGPARRLTSLEGYLSDPAWSPDGSTVALLYNPEAAGAGGPLEATPPRTGVIEAKISNQRLVVVPTGGEIRSRTVTPEKLNVYEYDWSPDGRSFAVTAAPGPADDNWYTARLYTVAAASGHMREVAAPDTQIALPRWSPDGKRLAFIGGLMSDEGFTGGDVYLVPVSGGRPRNLTAGCRMTPSWLSWLSPERLFLTAHRGGGDVLGEMDAASGRMREIWSGSERARAAGYTPNFSLSADGSASAIVRSSWSDPPEVWAGANGRWRQITHANARFRPEWGRARSLEWTSDEFRVQGWLLFPRDYSPARRYPMVVFPHGGPAGVENPAWPGTSYEPALFSAAGYFVFLPNPRGSFGQGEAFTRANVKDFGGGDLRDILRGVDAVLREEPVDPERVGITGWSYGGYMTMWAVTQTTRFRAAVAAAGIANWQSYYGENSIDQWMIPYFGASVYDDPAVYARSSPIHFIRQVKTPTLVVVGERDGECPAPQSFEFWHALKALGVPTQLVVYEGEGHAFRDPAHRRDVVRRAIDWFDRYLAPR